MYTQCPECRTTYRIGSTELRQAQGEVRCGACGISFNALESLSEGPPAEARTPPVAPTLGTRADDEPPLSIQDTGEHRTLDIPGDTLVGPAIDFPAGGATDREPVYTSWEDKLDYQSEEEQTADGEDAISSADTQPGALADEHAGLFAAATILPVHEPDTTGLWDDTDGITAHDFLESGETGSATAESDLEPEQEAAIAPGDTDAIAAYTVHPPEPDLTETQSAAESVAHDHVAVEFEADTGETDDRHQRIPEMPDAQAGPGTTKDDESIQTDTRLTAGTEAGTTDRQIPDDVSVAGDDARVGHQAAEEEPRSAVGIYTADTSEPEAFDDRVHTDLASYTEDWAEALLREAESLSLLAEEEGRSEPTGVPGDHDAPDGQDAVIEETTETSDNGNLPEPMAVGTDSGREPESADSSVESGEPAGTIRLGQDAVIEETTETSDNGNLPEPMADGTDSGREPESADSSVESGEPAGTIRLGQDVVDDALIAAGEAGVIATAGADDSAIRQDAKPVDIGAMSVAEDLSRDPGSLQLESLTDTDFHDDVDLPEAVEGGPGFARVMPRAGMQKPATAGRPHWADEFSEDEFEEIELPGTLDGIPATSQTTTDGSPTAGEPARTDDRSVAGRPDAVSGPDAETGVVAAAIPAENTADAWPDTSQAAVNSDWPRATEAGAPTQGATGLPRELDPGSAASTGRWRVPSLIALLLIVASAIVIHAQRADLMRSSTWAPVLERIYGALGMPLRANWDISAFRILDSSASAADSGSLTVNARFANAASFPQPMPILRVTLQNRWGQALNLKDFEPKTYLSAGPTGRYMRSNEQMTAVVTLPSPGDEAVGFSVDLCLDSSGDGLKCLSESTRQ